MEPQRDEVNQSLTLLALTILCGYRANFPLNFFLKFLNKESTISNII